MSGNIGPGRVDLSHQSLSNQSESMRLTTPLQNGPSRYSDSITVRIYSTRHSRISANPSHIDSPERDETCQFDSTYRTKPFLINPTRHAQSVHSPPFQYDMPRTHLYSPIHYDGPYLTLSCQFYPTNQIETKPSSPSRQVMPTSCRYKPIRFDKSMAFHFKTIRIKSMRQVNSIHYLVYPFRQTASATYLIRPYRHSKTAQYISFQRDESGQSKLYHFLIDKRKD